MVDPANAGESRRMIRGLVVIRADAATLTSGTVQQVDYHEAAGHFDEPENHEEEHRANYSKFDRGRCTPFVCAGEWQRRSPPRPGRAGIWVADPGSEKERHGCMPLVKDCAGVLAIVSRTAQRESASNFLVGR